MKKRTIELEAKIAKAKTKIAILEKQIEDLKHQKWIKPKCRYNPDTPKEWLILEMT